MIIKKEHYAYKTYFTCTTITYFFVHWDIVICADFRIIVKRFCAKYVEILHKKIHITLTLMFII